jgi:hypothetical protein
MTEKPVTLGDLAHVFHGVGNADIFTAEKLSKLSKSPEVVECLIIRAPDVMSLQPWHDPKAISSVSVSERFVSLGNRRGLNQSSKLQSGDLLLTTRGIPKISPILTYEITSQKDIVAGPEVLVIRAKPGVYPATLREAIKQKAASEYFKSHTTRKNKDKKPGKGYDKSGVLSKDVVCSLPIPDNLKDARPNFGENVEILAHKAESLISKIQSLNHAIVEASRWRAEQICDPILLSRFPHNETDAFSWKKTYQERRNEIESRANATQKALLEDWEKKDLSIPPPGYEWKKPYTEELDKLSESKERWASEVLCKCLISLSKNEEPSEDVSILCSLLVGKQNTAEARLAILGDRKKLEATTLLLQEGDQRASSTKVARSIRALLASCTNGCSSVGILSAEAGHLANEVMATDKAPETLALVEDNEPFRNLAKAICELHRKNTKIEAVERAYKLPKGLRFDIALLEASGADVDAKDNEKKLSEVFQWYELRERLAPKGRMVVHLPTTHWKLLKSAVDNIAMVLQLPPINLPAWSESNRQKYVPCDQGLIVVLKPGSTYDGQIKVIDATKINNGASATDLTPAQIKQLRSLIMEESSEMPLVTTTDVLRKDLKAFNMWPSIASFMRINERETDLVNTYTLESLVELFKYKHHLWKETQDKIFKEVGLLPGY